MAQFNAVGIEGLELSFKEFAEIPDSVIEEMLDAEAKVVVAAHKRSIESLGLVGGSDDPNSGNLRDSIKAHKKAGGRGNGFRRYVLVYPTGKHHTYSGVDKTKTYANSKSGRTYTTGGGEKVATNNDVGFVHEFGAPKRNIKASQWMLKANESSADAAATAAFKVYDKWLKSKNL